MRRALEALDAEVAHIITDEEHPANVVVLARAV